MKTAIYTLIIGVILGLIFIPQSFMLLVFSNIIIMAIAALGLNVIFGYTGQISIGHAAFMAIGAYTSAFLTSAFNVPILLNFILAMVFSAFFGIVIALPALRLKGFYLAIATMAFGIAIQEIIASLSILGGRTGMRNIPPIVDSEFGKFIINLVIYCLLVYITSVITKSPIGKKYNMVRDSETAATAFGVNIPRVKLQAFIISAIYGGIAGFLYAHTIGYIAPADFGLNVSLNLLAMVVIGGFASLNGGLIGSILITGMPFLFSRINFPMTIIVGGLLIVFVLFFPRGLSYGLNILYLNYFEVPLVWLIKKIHKNKRKGGSYIDINGKKIYYEVYGEGKPILMIHGNYASHNWFEKIKKINGYRIFTPDLPNFCYSEKIDNINIDEYANFMKEFMDKIGIEKTIVVGHSLGGAVAMSLAFRYPEKVEKLILVDAPSLKGLKTPEENYYVLNLLKRNRTLLKNSLRAMMPSLKDKKILNKLTNDAILMNPKCFTENARALENYNYEEIAKNFKGETLFILGKKDTLITKNMANEVIKHVDGELKIVPNVGHSIILEDPEAFIKIFQEFVQRK
jgi:branched-chain amino acid transport system permease protein